MQLSATRLAIGIGSNHQKTHWNVNPEEVWRLANFKDGEAFGLNFCQKFGQKVKDALTARVTTPSAEPIWAQCNRLWVLTE